MYNGIFLFAAFGITWTIIFIYVFRLFRSQKTLSRQLHKIQYLLQKSGKWERLSELRSGSLFNRFDGCRFRITSFEDIP